jgi:hypothetical protein
MQISFVRSPIFRTCLAVLALSCSAKETPATDPVTNPPASGTCLSSDSKWSYDICGNWTGPCRSVDGLRYRSNCNDVTTEQATNDSTPPPPTPQTSSTVPATGNTTPNATTPVMNTTAPIPPNNGTVTPPVTSPPATGTDVVPPGTATVPVDPSSTVPVDPSATVPMPTGTTVPPVPGTDPQGYWRQDDWKGCVWTGTDTQMAGTTLMPQDFLGGTTDGAYCISGSVAPTELWLGVALLGFNLNEDPATADCSYMEPDPTADGPPPVTFTSTGLALNFEKRGADTSFTLRVQIQGPNGGKEGAEGEADRWCSTILEPRGTAFIPWSEFNSTCWEPETGTAYAGEPISAVVFTVPGLGWPEGMPDDTITATPYDFCVNGFAAGESVADAPTGGVEAGDQTGTLGNNSATDRAKVQVDGENYIIQNNAWGAGAGLVLDYTNNSFTVTSATGSGQSAPASFPSIYVGANGFTNQGAYTTSTTDNLPVQIGSIASANTTFRWSGNNGSYNAAYDVWFANASPAGQRYNDGINGFIMVWLASPSGGQVPIGSDSGDETIAGHDWDVWVGNRGTGPSSEGAEIASDPNARVVSFVIKGGAVNSLTFNLKDFIDVATANYQFSSSMWLTDVFAGFEIWNGGQGLTVDEFAIDVQTN